MNSLSATAQMIAIVNDFGASALLILGYILVLCTGFLVLYFGSRKLAAVTGESPVIIESRISARNRRYAAQIRNSEILAMGDKVGTIDSMR